MTLQDRAAQWLLTVQGTWEKATPGPWKLFSYGLDNEVNATLTDCLGKQHANRRIVMMDSDEYAMLGMDEAGDGFGPDQCKDDAAAISLAPTHLSEGQALVRELLAEVERLKEGGQACADALVSGTKYAGQEADALKADNAALLGALQKVAYYFDIDSNVLLAAAIRDELTKDHPGADLLEELGSLKAQLAAKDETERVLEKALEMAMNEAGYSPDLISSFIHQAEKALGVKPLLIDAAQTASEGE